MHVSSVTDWLRSWSNGACVAANPKGGHCSGPADFIFSFFRFSGSMRRLTQAVWFLCRDHAEQRAKRHGIPMPINHELGPLFELTRTTLTPTDASHAVPVDFVADVQTTSEFLKGVNHGATLLPPETPNPANSDPPSR